MQTRHEFIPIVPMRGIVALPGDSIKFEVGRDMSIRAVDEAIKQETGILLVCQTEPARMKVDRDSLYSIGAYCEIINIKNADHGIIHITATAKARAEIEEFLECDNFFAANIICHEDEPMAEEQALQLKSTLTYCVTAFLRQKTADNNVVEKLRDATYEDYMCYPDTVAGFFAHKYTTKQKVLEAIDLVERYNVVCKLVVDEQKLAALDTDIEAHTKSEIEKSQKEYYLRTKISAIKHELGDDLDSEIEEFKKRAEEKNLPDNVRERLNKELRKLEGLPLGSHEAPSIRGFIECILDLPWTEESVDVIDINRARDIMDRDHYGMEKVKKRITEYLAVAERTKNLNGQIICLVGPPGVGKTSIVASIAEAVGRQFIRMSLGGIDDESEIRGHRRAYIGAMPGRIIAAMRQSETVNPLILFDEIDKLNKSLHGDPAAAMLEVLDSAQNNSFRDHYLEIPYDLSKVMFITTANTKDTIPRPLLDRMEIIEVPGYLEYEKVQIALRHFIPRQLKQHGLKERELSFGEDAVYEIVRGYTRESGVRELDRVIAKMCRNAACELHEGKKTLTATHNRIVKYLGEPKYSYDKADDIPQVGVVNGLAWTQVGGETLTIEVVTIPDGSGKIELTGNLGDVMKESAQAAFTYVRANAHKYGVTGDFFKTHDIHVHVPEGAIPKDGPSAGISMATAIMSAVANIPVTPRVAMTGEITLRGKVLKIGGLREKLLAAVRAGITTAIVPEENRPDVNEMEGEIKNNIKIEFASDTETVLRHALQIKKTPIRINTASSNERLAING